MHLDADLCSETRSRAVNSGGIWTAYTTDIEPSGGHLNEWLCSTPAYFGLKSDTSPASAAGRGATRRSRPSIGRRSGKAPDASGWRVSTSQSATATSAAPYMLLQDGVATSDVDLGKLGADDRWWDPAPRRLAPGAHARTSGRSRSIVLRGARSSRPTPTACACTDSSTTSSPDPDPDPDPDPSSPGPSRAAGAPGRRRRRTWAPSRCQ